MIARIRYASGSQTYGRVLGPARDPEQPPAYPTSGTANPAPSFGTTNYGFDNTNTGTAGGYPMSNPVGNQGGYGYNPTANQYSSNVVVAQVGPSAGPVYSAAPQDYTTQAWLACLCCFWPTGLLAIMRANESRECLARGDMVGAHSAANSARQMVIISVVVGVIAVIGVGIFLGVYIGVVLNNVNNIYNNNY